MEDSGIDFPAGKDVKRLLEGSGMLWTGEGQKRLLYVCSV